MSDLLDARERVHVRSWSSPKPTPDAEAMKLLGAELCAKCSVPLPPGPSVTSIAEALVLRTCARCRPAPF